MIQPSKNKTIREPVKIRRIQKVDEIRMAQIIRSSLEEFGAAKQGTVYFDETTDHLFDLFKTPNSAYFVAEVNGVLSGGSGIFPTAGLETDTCELVKMYVASSARNLGIGRLLLQTCIQEARDRGFHKMYIETMPELTNAIRMYQKTGFEFISGAMGASGHGGCSLFMLKNL